MKWIYVEDDLPPPGVKCLVLGTHRFVHRKDGAEVVGGAENIIIEATFCPKAGWSSPVGFILVEGWHPLNLNPTDKSTQQTSEECQAACESLDDNQH